MTSTTVEETNWDLTSNYSPSSGRGPYCPSSCRLRNPTPHHSATTRQPCRWWLPSCSARAHSRSSKARRAVFEVLLKRFCSSSCQVGRGALLWTGSAAPARLPRPRVAHAQPSAVRGQRAERSDMACGKRRGRLCGIKEVRMVSHAGDAGRDRRATSYFFTRERVVRVGTGVGCVHSTKWVTL